MKDSLVLAGMFACYFLGCFISYWRGRSTGFKLGYSFSNTRRIQVIRYVRPAATAFWHRRNLN